MLEIILTDDSAVRDTLIDETIHSALIEKRGAASIVDLASVVRSELGDYQLLGIRSYSGDRIDVEFDTWQWS